MKTEEKIEIVKSYMTGCNGTNEYHTYPTISGIGYLSDGVKLVAETFGAFWMIDIILSYQTRAFTLKNHENGDYTQYWSLDVNEKNGAVASMSFHEDDEGNAINVITQDIEFTDFPMKSFLWKFNSYDKVLCLLAED